MSQILVALLNDSDNGNTTTLRSEIDRLPDRLLERPWTASGAILDVHFESAAGADAGDGGRRKHQDEGLAQP